MELSKKAIEAIRSDQRTKNRLALSFNCSYFTIQRWMNENNVMLTTAQALEIIQEESGLSLDEILIKEEATK